MWSHRTRFNLRSRSALTGGLAHRPKPAARHCRFEPLEGRNLLAAGMITTSIGGVDDAGFAATVTADDGLFVAGRSVAAGDDSDFGLVRYDSRGKLESAVAAPMAPR